MLFLLSTVAIMVKTILKGNKHHQQSNSAWIMWNAVARTLDKCTRLSPDLPNCSYGVAKARPCNSVPLPCNLAHHLRHILLAKSATAFFLIITAPMIAPFIISPPIRPIRFALPMGYDQTSAMWLGYTNPGIFVGSWWRTTNLIRDYL